MKVKITDRTEMMFSQAMTLAQNGMMKNTIHAHRKDVFILNMDDTILIHFTANQDFPEMVSFFGNDYESQELEIDKGQVIFIQYNNNYSRRKTCPVPKINFQDVQTTWKKFSPNKDNIITFHKGLLSLLDDDLSHVELSCANQTLKIVQKNIYSGSRIEVEDKLKNDGLISSGSGMDFEPIGIRTTDFKALFSFTDQLNFYIQPGHNWIYFSDPYGVIEGIFSTCLYDELAYIAEVK